ncbi:hypothetical protein BC941DRAFT_432091 [Chlamydoabsidia padenii]|nr:hypothetical protein BC941DRAFT_432091 [Chlamydoabsidia padenii]
MLHAIALYDCVADEEGELSFSVGTRFVDVVDSSEENWLEGRIEGTSQRGLLPSNYVNVISVPSPTVIKSIPKSTTFDTGQGRSVSPPNSNISSSWSVISNGPMTPNTSTYTDNNNNKSDAFDTAMHGLPSSKYSDIATTLLNKRTMPKPSTTEFTQVNSNNSVKASPKLFDKKPGLVHPILQQTTRARSFSASSSTLPSRSDPDTTLLKPSALRQDGRLGTQLDTASWRTRVENGIPSSTNGDGARRPSLNVIGNKVNMTGSSGNDDEDVEEEDGYQLIKPSQLRKRQQQGQSKEATTKMMLPVTLPLSTSASTSVLPSQKTSNGIRLETLPSSSTLAKLPSRPVSQANRLNKSRSSSTKSNRPTTSTSSTTPSSVSNNNKPAPTLKPKPAQLNHLPKASVTLPRSTTTTTTITKERSASNPPAIQPKNFSLDSHRPNKPTIESKPMTFKTSSIQPVENSIISERGTRGGVALPGLGKKNSAPSLPIRNTNELIFKDRQLLNNNNGTNDDTNIKPSQLLTTQRARSSTNPSFATRPHIDTNSKSLLIASLDGGAIRSPPPPPPSLTLKSTTKSSSLPAIALTIKQAPPPPPSRHTKSRRYDDLFDSIQDDGFVDGMTTRLVWKKSRLPNETLATIWQHCDQRKSGLLDRQRFIDGMIQIDSYLAKNKSVSSTKSLS